MEIKIQEIPEEGLLLSFAEDPSTWGLAEKGLAIEGPIRVLLKVIKHNDKEVYIRGSVSAEIRSECSRCLNQFSDPIQSEFHINYVPITEVHSEQERELLKDDLDLHFYKGDLIEVNEVIQSQLFLASPMRPLCKPECRGLCPQCGEDLNRIECSCPKDPPDVRWAELKNFFRQNRRDER